MANETNVKSALNRDVLLQSWARLSVYDRTSSRLKTYFVQRRYLVISLTLVATVASVLTGITGQGFWAAIFGIISVVLPIAGTYIMNDIVKFTGTTTWIKYRYIAETMRMHIYLYRMKAGPYANLPLEQSDDLLSENIRAAREEIDLDEVIPFTVREPIEEQEIIAVIKEANQYTPEEDGLSEIQLENYIRWRLINQRQWYDSRVHDDYSRLKTNFRWSQAVLLAGALISALAGFINIQIVTLVAVTNALSVALTSYSNVSMFGKTYSLFLITSLKLGDLLRNWYALSNNPELQVADQRAVAVADFVKRIEDALLEERQAWYELAIQVQTTSDQTILSNLEKLTQRTQTDQV